MHLLTVVKMVHLIGLVMGFGGAVLLDLTIFKHGVLRPISKYTIHQAEMLSKVVSWGLTSLWCSGVALIVINLMDKPEYLTNQKLWAKIIIVVLLTLNGIFIHNRVLPYLKNQLGHRLFDNIESSDAVVLTFAGSISFVSWTTPFILGKASELNYVTPMWLILSVYLIAVLLAWIVMYTVMTSIAALQNFARKVATSTLEQSATWEDMAAPQALANVSMLTSADPQYGRIAIVQREPELMKQTG